MWKLIVCFEMLRIWLILYVVLFLVVQYSILCLCVVSVMFVVGDSFGIMKWFISECDRFVSQLVCSVSMLILVGVSWLVWWVMFSSLNVLCVVQFDCVMFIDNLKLCVFCYSGYGLIWLMFGYMIMLVLSVLL